MTEAAGGLEADALRPQPRAVVDGLGQAAGEPVVLGLLDAMFAEAPVGLAVFDATCAWCGSTGRWRRPAAAAPTRCAAGPSPRPGCSRSPARRSWRSCSARCWRAGSLHQHRAARARRRPGGVGCRLTASAGLDLGLSAMRVWSVSLFRLHDEAGEPAGVGGLVLDDTDRLRAEGAARLANDRLALLAAASHVLGNSLETDETLQALTGVTVPAVADVAMIDLVDGKGRLRRHARASTPGASGQHVWARQGGGGDPRRPSGPARPRRAAQRAGDLAVETDLSELSPSPEVAEDARRIGLHSLLSVPLIAHTGTLGVATFRRVAGRPAFDDAELVLAEQLAGRAAVAIEHAAVRPRARDRADAPAQPAPEHLPEPEGLEVESYYLPGTAGTQVGGDWYDLIPLPAGRRRHHDRRRDGARHDRRRGDGPAQGRGAPPRRSTCRRTRSSTASDALVRGLDDEGGGQLVTCMSTPSTTRGRGAASSPTPGTCPDPELRSRAGSPRPAGSRSGWAGSR